MSKDLIVGNLKAAPGNKVRGYLEVVNFPELKMPVTLINGAKEGKTVVITGGTHGGEYPGVETSIRLAKNIEPAQVAGKLIIVHPVNVAAYFAKLQYIGPYDGKNLNRMYPGSATGTVSEKIAYTIANELFKQADFYMDLHGGDIHEGLTPFVIVPSAKISSPEVYEIARKGAEQLGIKYVVNSVSTNGTIGCAASMGVPSFLAEIGQCGLWSEEEVQTYYRGVMNVLRFLNVIEGDCEKLCETILIERGMDGVDAGVDGCWYPSVVLEEKVKKGQKIGEIRDFFGNVLEEIFAPIDGVMLYIITSLAIKAGEPLVALG